jgi:uncharacterized membrane protein YfhO
MLTDLHFPGWDVYIDSVKSTYYVANRIFKGVFLDSGQHTISFKFRPWVFIFCAIISVSTYVFSLSWIGLAAMQKHKNKLKPSATVK